MGRLKNKPQKLGRSWRRQICQNCIQEDATEGTWSPIPGLGNRSCHWQCWQEMYTVTDYGRLSNLLPVSLLYLLPIKISGKISNGLSFSEVSVVKCQELGRTFLSFSKGVSSNTGSLARTCVYLLQLLSS